MNRLLQFRAQRTGYPGMNVKCKKQNLNTTDEETKCEKNVIKMQIKFRFSCTKLEVFENTLSNLTVAYMTFTVTV